MSKLLTLERGSGKIRHAGTEALPHLLRPGDLLVVNDAATLPASLKGLHEPTGRALELRLARALEAPMRWEAVAFGEGDWHQRTEDRPAPPALREGDRLRFDADLDAEVERADGRWLTVRLSVLSSGESSAIWARLYRAGRLIQYSYAPRELELWDNQTLFAGPPVALEPPSAAFALDWALIDRLEARGVGLAALTHSAGISSTGDPALDRMLPLPERYWVPERTWERVAQTRRRGGRVVAVGTSVVRALESVGRTGRRQDVTALRLSPLSALRVVDGLLTGVHEAGSSHRELLGAFVGREALERACSEAERGGYRLHERGDSFLLL